MAEGKTLFSSLGVRVPGGRETIIRIRTGFVYRPRYWMLIPGECRFFVSTKTAEQILLKAVGWLNLFMRLNSRFAHW
jgi:hypothetical protein